MHALLTLLILLRAIFVAGFFVVFLRERERAVFFWLFPPFSPGEMWPSVVRESGVCVSNLEILGVSGRSVGPG